MNSCLPEWPESLGTVWRWMSLLTLTISGEKESDVVLMSSDVVLISTSATHTSCAERHTTWDSFSPLFMCRWCHAHACLMPSRLPALSHCSSHERLSVVIRTPRHARSRATARARWNWSECREFTVSAERVLVQRRRERWRLLSRCRRHFSKFKCWLRASRCWRHSTGVKVQSWWSSRRICLSLMTLPSRRQKTLMSVSQDAVHRDVRKEWSHFSGGKDMTSMRWTKAQEKENRKEEARRAKAKAKASRAMPKTAIGKRAGRKKVTNILMDGLGKVTNKLMGGGKRQIGRQYLVQDGGRQRTIVHLGNQKKQWVK